MRSKLYPWLHLVIVLWVQVPTPTRGHCVQENICNSFLKLPFSFRNSNRQIFNGVCLIKNSASYPNPYDFLRYPPNTSQLLDTEEILDAYDEWKQRDETAMESVRVEVHKKTSKNLRKTLKRPWEAAKRIFHVLEPEFSGFRTEIGGKSLNLIREIVFVYIADIKTTHVELFQNKMKNVRHPSKSAENARLDRIWTLASKNTDTGFEHICRWLGSDKTNNKKTNHMRCFP